MEKARFEHLKAQVGGVSAAQTLELEDLIQCIVAEKVAETALERRAKQTRAFRICPHCRSKDIVLHGNDQNGRQRFKCRGCRKTYNILTGTPMARARKPETWVQYLGCMTEHMPLREIVASGIGVHLVTAWRWRHRFLQAAANDNASVLSGLVEADTTFFQQSFKGTRGLSKGKPPEGRSDCPRGWGAADRTSSPGLVPVLTALDCSGGVFEVILTSLAEIEAVLNGRIAAGSVLCSNGNSAYIHTAERAKAEHYVVFVPGSTPHAVATDRAVIRAGRKGFLGLRRVNNYHQQLKYLVNGRCRGVATKYLPHYLGWHRAMTRPGFAGRMLLDRALR